MDELLSEAQRKYFKNSKVRDKDGNLLVAYHGSGTKIEAFDPFYTGKGSDQYGSGFYFTTEKDFASTYTKIRNTDVSGREMQKLGGEDSPSIVKAYLNIENPIVINVSHLVQNLSGVLIPNNLVYDIVKKLPTLYHTIDNENEPNPLSDYSERFWDVKPKTQEEFEPLIKEMTNKYFQNTDLKTLDIFFGKYGTELRNAIHENLGYDGVIAKFKDNQHFVAWFPEQIKDVNNLYPEHTNKLMDGETVIVAQTKDESLIQGTQDLFQKPQAILQNTSIKEEIEKAIKKREENRTPVLNRPIHKKTINMTKE
ncbi:MAG: hypothetical protein RR602_03245 [Longicatena sp.]